MILEVREDEHYYYDSEAAEKAIRFIEKFCQHFEGKSAGAPFVLLDWQKEIIRTLFGWKRRADGLRRFRELYLLTAKGAGKTPLIAALGLFCLLEDGEAGAHVVSMATSFEQANLTFDAAKKYIALNKDLQRFADPKQHQIKAPKVNGKWTTVSGKPNGRSGPRPSCIIADEVHEWEPWTGEAYEMLCANLFKRSQPLLLVATNAGASKSCYAWKLHERALRVLDGTLDDPTLLPVIYEAPEDVDPFSEDAAKAANPSLGTFIKWEQLAPEVAKAKADPEDEARYKRLYLSQWHQSGKKWIPMPLWNAAHKAFNPADLKDAALYVGLDMALSDDLCAVAYAYATPDRLYVDTHYWMPRVVAAKYQAQGVTYLDWEPGGFITLIDEPTISDRVHRQIAAHVIERGKQVKIKVVSYDRARANMVIATLDAAGVTTVATPQGYSLTLGCAELDRRLKEQSITIVPNPVLDFCAENVEVTYDRQGNYWPIKPGAKGNYAGKRAAKIDGIVAIVNALVESRKHAFPSSKRPFSGKTWTV